MAKWVQTTEVMAITSVDEKVFGFVDDPDIQYGEWCTRIELHRTELQWKDLVFIIQRCLDNVVEHRQTLTSIAALSDPYEQCFP